MHAQDSNALERENSWEDLEEAWMERTSGNEEGVDTTLSRFRLQKCQTINLPLLVGRRDLT